MVRCAIYEKTARFENNVSHSHRKSGRIWKVNVKSVKVRTESGVRRMYTCISCLRPNFVERA